MGCQGSKEDVKADGEKYLLETLTGHKESINCMVLSEDESVLVTGDDEETRVWDVDKEGGKKDRTECIGTLRGHRGYVTCLCVAGVYVITGSSDCTVKKWDMTTSDCCFTYEGHKGKVKRVVCTGKYIISSSSDCTAKVWIFDTSDVKPEMMKRCCVYTLEGHTMGVHPLVYIPPRHNTLTQTTEMNNETKHTHSNKSELELEDNELVVTGSADNTARLWSLVTGDCLVIYRDHKGPIMTMTTDGDAKILFTGSEDTTVRSYEIITGRPLKVFDGHTSPIMCVLVVNQLMYTGDTHGAAKCWVWKYGDQTREYKGHKYAVTCVKFSKGMVYTGSGDGLVRAFDAKTGALRKVFRSDSPGGDGGGGVINCIVICDGRMFTGGNDGLLRVWNVDNV